MKIIPTSVSMSGTLNNLTPLLYPIGYTQGVSEGSESPNISGRLTFIRPCFVGSSIILTFPYIMEKSNKNSVWKTQSLQLIGRFCLWAWTHKCSHSPCRSVYWTTGEITQAGCYPWMIRAHTAPHPGGPDITHHPTQCCRSGTFRQTRLSLSSNDFTGHCKICKPQSYYE